MKNLYSKNVELYDKVKKLEEKFEDLTQQHLRNHDAKMRE